MDKQKSFMDNAVEVIARALENKELNVEVDKHMKLIDAITKIIIDQYEESPKRHDNMFRKVICIVSYTNFNEMRKVIVHTTVVNLVKAKDFTIRIIKSLGKQIKSISIADKIKIGIEVIKLIIDNQRASNKSSILLVG